MFIDKLVDWTIFRFFLLFRAHFASIISCFFYQFFHLCCFFRFEYSYRNFRFKCSYHLFWFEYSYHFFRFEYSFRFSFVWIFENLRIFWCIKSFLLFNFRANSKLFVLKYSLMQFLLLNLLIHIKISIKFWLIVFIKHEMQNLYSIYIKSFSSSYYFASLLIFRNVFYNSFAIFFSLNCNFHSFW